MFFENLSRILKFHYNLSRIKSTVLEDLCTRMIIFHGIVIRMKNVSDKSRREKTNMFCSIFFFSKTLAFVS